MTTPNDTARTWREVADRLTAAQIAQLERLERDEPQTLLEMARQWAAKNMTAAAPFDHIAPPAGAVRTFGWQLDSNWFRDFEGTTRARRAGPRSDLRPAAGRRLDSAVGRGAYPPPGRTGRAGDPQTGGSADRCGRRDRAAQLSRSSRQPGFAESDRTSPHKAAA
jgi:hypothetical protein